jgi:hypothetical protein
MDKRSLIRIIGDILNPLGFKKKGNFWVLDRDTITKMVNLQRSQFSERFYLNYGYIIKALPLGGLTMHIFYGLGSSNPLENARINALFDLEVHMKDDEREVELRKFLKKILVTKIHSIETEEDILDELMKRPHLNDVPLVVKKHFNLK